MVRCAEKRGQIQLSFGMIFSIIIIIATLAVGSYVIYYFWQLNNKLECQLYKNEIQKQIDKIWAADGQISYPFSYSVSAKTEMICFGLISQQSLDKNDEAAFTEAKRYSDMRSNLYIYPRQSCGQAQFRYTLNHVNTTNFFCIDNVGGKVEVKLSKGSFDAFVKMSE